MKKRIAILGVQGSIGSRHSRNFRELGCEVRGYDIATDPTSGPLPERDGVIRWADAVVIATPTDQHCDDIFACRRHSGKPCFVEKPIVNTTAQSRMKMPNVLMVGYNLRFHSCVKKAREWMEKGVIGKPLWARFTCAQYNDKPDYRRDGVILNWSHEIDLALHLLGKAEFMHSNYQCENGCDTIADILLHHYNNFCTTSIHLDYVTRWERRNFLIVGERGSIEADLVGRQIFHRDNTGKFVDSFYGRDSFDGNYLAEARAFLTRLDGQEANGCTADEAVQVVDICLQAKEKANGK